MAKPQVNRSAETPNTFSRILLLDATAPILKRARSGLEFAVLACIHVGHALYKTTNDKLDMQLSLQLFRKHGRLLLASLPVSTLFMIFYSVSCLKFF
jgi:hypothetical protein